MGHSIMAGKSKILVVGGTGHMGVYLCGILCSMGYEVICTSRKRSGTLDGIRYVCGNGMDIGFLLHTIDNEKPDAIVDFMHYSTDQFKERYKLILARTNQYLFLSSYRVYADESPLKEDSPQLLETLKDAEYLRTDEYALAKSRQERLLRNSGYKNWTILRPSIIYSQECFKLGCLEANVVCYRALNGLPVVMPKEMLTKRAALTWGKDAALLIARLVLNEKAMGEDFIVSSSEPLTWSDVAKVYSDVIGLRLECMDLTQYCNICNRYQVLYDRMFDRCVDNSKILKVTSTNPSELMPFREGLTRELTQFAKSPHYRGINIKQNAVIDRLCRTVIPLNDLSITHRILYYKEKYVAIGKFVDIALHVKHLLEGRTR